MRWREIRNHIRRGGFVFQYFKNLEFGFWNLEFPSWSTLAPLGCSRERPHLKMQTLPHLRRGGFLFRVSLQEQALDGSPKKKTPQHSLRGLRFK